MQSSLRAPAAASARTFVRAAAAPAAAAPRPLQRAFVVPAQGGFPPPSSLLRKRGDPIEKKTQSINPLYFTTNPIPQPLLAAPSRLQAQPDAPLSSCELQAEKRARKVRKHGGRETICFFSFSSDVFFSFANHLSRPPPPPNYNEQSAGPGSSAVSSRPSCGSTRPRGSSETFSSSEKRAVRWLLRAPLLLPPTTASLS